MLALGALPSISEIRMKASVGLLLFPEHQVAGSCQIVMALAALRDFRLFMSRNRCAQAGET